MLKMQPKTDWEKQRKEENGRVRLARAVGAAMLRDPHVFRDEKNARDLEEIADILPTISVIEELAKIDAADASLLKASAGSAARSRNRKPKKATKVKAAPKRKAKAASPKAAAKKTRTGKSLAEAVARTAGPAKEGRRVKDLKLAGDLEDEALDVANEVGAVSAGDLLKAFPFATRGQVTSALARLVARERLMCSGKGRYTKYTLPNGAGAKTKTQLELGEAAATKTQLELGEAAAT